MSYRKIDLLPTYETGVNDLVNEFYIPVLAEAKRYDRIAGFFSSTSLALAARGLAGLIKNSGTMRLITCPRLELCDVKEIEAIVAGDNSTLEKLLIKEIGDIEFEFQRDHISALGWLLSKNILQMRIALVSENDPLLGYEQSFTNFILHQKVGVLYDEETNGVAFSGSINESASGWLNNVEEFKVFRSWVGGEEKYFNSDRDKFERMWNGNHPSIAIKRLPDAVAEKLIESGKDFDVEKISPQQYTKHHIFRCASKMHKEELKLFYYQEEAVQKWQQSNKRMLLEMATGCGKTRTAIGCIKYLIDKDIKPFLVVIACPGNTLSVQWKSDIDHLNICIEKSIMCDDTNPGWREDMKKLLIQLSVGYYRNSIIYTTHQTCSSPDFISYIKGLSRKVRTFFIGDEVHGLGARKAQKGLLNEYEMRLGLSATPSRWYDPNGSEVIQKYFGEVSYEFSIKDALRITNPLTGKPFLINYFYYPHFVSLTDEELTKYKNLTERIIKLSGKNDESEQSKLERLLFQRANIEKSAENKYPELEVILDKIAPKIEDTIIFVSPDQINRVLCILARKGISAHSFTEKEGTRPSEEFGGISERDYLIRQFKQKQYKVLVAIKCLDEGIDIPSARCAIVMASSTNPREYIQRIGRVIRQDKNKGNAEIYDMIIRPNIPNGFSEDFIKMEQRIFRKEMDRVLELSENSLNNVNIVNQVYKIIEGLKR